VRRVVRERRAVAEIERLGMDRRVDPEVVERAEEPLVDVRAGGPVCELEGPPAAVGRRDDEPVLEQVELHLDVAVPVGMGPVVSPRVLRYSVTCHQWLRGGVSAIRTLPTICA
jgi:hypothetical protein